MDDDPRLFEVFLDVQRGLPRQGPGLDEITLKVLALCRGLPERPAVLDIGCGPGMQTMALARAVDGPITAIDVHEEYLDILEARAAEAGVAGRMNVRMADMSSLPFRPESFDLVWSEGAAYIMGFAAALTDWKVLLRPGGFIAVSELVWLRPDPPAEMAAFFAAEYPAMTDIETNLSTVEDCGYEPFGHIILSDDGWWRHYYSPLEAKLPEMRETYAGDEEALGVIDMTAREIDMRRRFGDWYGYAFFVGQKP